MSYKIPYIFNEQQLKQIEIWINNDKTYKWIGEQLKCSSKTIKRNILRKNIPSLITTNNKIYYTKTYIENGIEKQISFIQYLDKNNNLYKESCFEYGRWWHRNPQGKGITCYFRTCINYERIILHRYKYEIENKCSIIDGEIDHINGDKSDNSLSNLQLLSSKEHTIKTHTGRIKSPEEIKKLSNSLKITLAKRKLSRTT